MFEPCNRCKQCKHRNVCAYKEHYEDAIDRYAKVAEECGKYPYFKLRLECIEYLRDNDQFMIKRGMEDGNDS